MEQKELIIKNILDELIKKPHINSKEDFHKLKNEVYKDYKIDRGISDIELLSSYKSRVKEGELAIEDRILKLLRKRAVRSLSWVAVVSILTKPWKCPWNCIYCPNFDNLPKSYIPNEPAVMRASLNDFDAIMQVHNRLRSLDITWHNTDKCDVRIIWWTWSVYEENYREAFIKNIYDAHNTYEELSSNIISTELWSEKFAAFKVNPEYNASISSTLNEAKERNENSKSRVIWIAVETRPDYINENEIKLLRKYWITRVEIWYQSTIDEINILNKRWHTNFESKNATKLLKDAWFKVVAHIMPNLLGSTIEKDIQSLKNVFDDSDFRPDELKIYPMVVTDNSELTQIWKKWEFTPYSDSELIDLMVKLQEIIPEYVRLNRMYRDIPASEILAWSHLANLRQIVDEEMKIRWIKRMDISAREIRLKWNNPNDAIIDVTEYDASSWKEYYIQYVDIEDRTLFSHLRLRIPSQIFSWEEHFIPVLKNAAIIREVHTYWDQLKIWEKWDLTGQHIWFGKKLMEKAEEIIRLNYPQIRKIAVIAWVWVRWYYRKNWYKLEWEYMVKEL